MSQSKGFQRERELVNSLYDAGFSATRVPKSGGGTKRELPDIIAGDGEEVYAIEAKARTDGIIYLTGDEIIDLVRFARNINAKPRIGARYDREDWYFFHPGDLYETEAGHFRIKKETVLAEGVSFADLTSTSRRISLSNLESTSKNLNRSDSLLDDILDLVEKGEISAQEASELL